MKSQKKLIGTSIITALAASLCCITPIVALIAGSSSLASSFSWLDPLRPYLIGLTIVVLVIAWFQKLKPKSQASDCECVEEFPKFTNTKSFLFIVTLFAALMLAFPLYAKVFYPNQTKEVVFVAEANLETVEYHIKGMTCSGCEAHIENEVNKLDGIKEVNANYEKGSTHVNYDKNKVTLSEIETAIGKTGYEIIYEWK
jgi:copper ion binding protein